jgi:phage tail sheath protein FI
MAYEHGIRITEREGGTRPVAGSATEVLGLVSVASDADVATFPLDTPVLLTDVRGALSKAGELGKLAAALEAIAAQTNPIIVVVRTTEGSGAGAEATTETNVLAGIDRLLAAESQLGYRPRILGAPGLDSQAVAERLASVAARLRGFTYTSCGAADTVAEAVTYRAEFSAREQMLIYPGTSKGAADAIARAMGLQFPISFDIMSSDNDAGVLNDAEVTTIVRQNGYRFWGNSTCSDDPLFRFESVVRTNQALQDEIAAGLAWAVDKPLGGGLLKDILETINGRFRSLRAQGRVIGAEAYFDASLNPAGDLAAGKVRIPYRYTACAPAESIGVLPEITDEYYATIGQGL